MKHEPLIRNLLSAGRTVNEIAEQLGTNQGNIRAHMRYHDIKMPPQARSNAANKTMKIAKLMLDGKTEGEIAKTLGVSETRVRTLQLKGGLRTKGPKQPARMQALLEQGKSVPEVAAELGLKTSTVYSVCSRNGIVIPQRSGERKKEVAAEIRRLQGLGISAEGIAYATGLTPDLVYTYQSGKGGRPRNNNEELVVEALRRGDSVDMISGSLNLMPGTVVFYGRRNGFSFKRDYVVGKEVVK